MAIRRPRAPVRELASLKLPSGRGPQSRPALPQPATRRGTFCAFPTCDTVETDCLHNRDRTSCATYVFGCKASPASEGLSNPLPVVSRKTLQSSMLGALQRCRVNTASRRAESTGSRSATARCSWCTTVHQRRCCYAACASCSKAVSLLSHRLMAWRISSR
jgi:hypothetical protein